MEVDPCKKCGRYVTEEGHDYCMANLPGVMNACCGHGGSNEPYVQFLDGYSIHGEDAEKIMILLKYHRR